MSFAWLDSDMMAAQVRAWPWPWPYDGRTDRSYFIEPPKSRDQENVEKIFFGPWCECSNNENKQ